MVISEKIHLVLENHLLFQMSPSTAVTPELAQLPLGKENSVLHHVPSWDWSCWHSLAQEGEKAHTYTNVISKGGWQEREKCKMGGNTQKTLQNPGKLWASSPFSLQQKAGTSLPSLFQSCQKCKPNPHAIFENFTLQAILSEDSKNQQGSRRPDGSGRHWWQRADCHPQPLHDDSQAHCKDTNCRALLWLDFPMFAPRWVFIGQNSLRGSSGRCTSPAQTHSWPQLCQH